MTRTPTSMTGIFADLHANRREAAAATKRFVVVSLTKKGTPCKVTAQDLQYNATATQEAAGRRQQILEQLNPGKVFIIIAL